jgi:hypothetical protein
MKRLNEKGVPTNSFMLKNAEHDVVKWLTVIGDLIAHKKAIEYIKTGFKLD